MNYIGIDIGGTNLKAGLTDENGRLLAVKSMKIREVSDPDVLADTLVTLTEELAAQGGIAVQDIASAVSYTHLDVYKRQLSNRK